MVDKSSYPCRKCKHIKRDHGSNFDICYACEDAHKSRFCKFERIANLEFLEWLDKKKENKDER